ncbi:MAG TPA: sulfite exporter TauE/SafE family protein [Anaeromyxobacteraceae bacterium]
MVSELILPAAGLLAGAMNAVAGGGSFVTFPALVLSGVPSVAANASSTVALFPGAVSSAWAFREDFRTLHGVPVRALLPVSTAGGLVGALLLLFTPDRLFDAVIPWLLLGGTLAFALGPHVSSRLRRALPIGKGGLFAAQFLLGIYGGYFGGAVGLMMMAVWSVLGVTDVRAMVAGKALLVGAANAAAVLCFAAAGQVWWARALTMALAATVGGYAGARFGRRLPVPVLRGAITAFNVAITVAFFLRAHR